LNFAIFSFFIYSLIGNKDGRVYWTSMTRNGCAGQFSQCLPDGKSNIFTSHYSMRIVSKSSDGACVTIYGTAIGDSFFMDEQMFKTELCDSLHLLACQGEILSDRPTKRYLHVSIKIIFYFNVRMILNLDFNVAIL